ncbi:3TM-type holin [Magnetovibrio sp. PR-2]|uniref:3TM-type holin n=1 Tax=Magnetovibrio sp. PR-2 TaxID=3120356 RepID=UPI002FCDE51F
MSFLGKLLGGGVVSAAKGVADIVDQFVETDDEKRAFESLKIKLAMNETQVQAGINQIEAGHRSIFVAGWRPFIGWTCGSALAWTYVGQPVVLFVMAVAGIDTPTLPALDLSVMMPVLLGMLGLGGLRTIEKLGGKSK